MHNLKNRIIVRKKNVVFLFAITLIIFASCETNKDKTQKEETFDTELEDTVINVESFSKKSLDTVDISSFSPKVNISEAQCVCKEESLNFEYLCDTTVFSNKSKLYYTLNCDEAKLIFENQANQKVVLNHYEGEDLMLVDRVGLFFIKEYEKYLLFARSLSSGSIDPVDIVFINKETGKTIKHIDSERFIVEGEIDNLEYVAYLKNTNSNVIEVLFHDSGKKYKTSFKQKKLEEILSNGILKKHKAFRRIIKKDNSYYLPFECLDKKNDVEIVNLLLK